MRSRTTPIRPRSLFMAFTVSCGLLLLIALSLGHIRSFINNDISKHAQSDWQNALNSESKEVSQNADQLAHSDLISLYLQQNEVTNLITYSVEETNRRNLDSILVMNKDGLVLSRSLSPNRTGDYLAETTSWAAEVIQGRTFTSVEQGLSNLALLSGEPILKDGQAIGGVITSHVLNDAYAQKVRNTYWPAGTEIAFVSTRDGFTGSSFADPATSTLLRTYLSQPASFLQFGGSTPAEIKIGSQYYVVTAIPLQGLSNSVGSIIVFVPDPVVNNIILLALFVALAFFLVEVFIHRKLIKTKKNKYHIGMLVACELILFGVSSTFLAFLWLRPAFNVSQPLYTIYNSTITMSPDTNLIQEGFEQRVAIQVTIGGEYINSGEAEILYDPSKVDIEEIVTDHSFCDENLFIQRDIDPAAGKVTIVCGLPNPGFTGTGTLAELVLKPLEPGTFTLKFTDNTTVLANDGLATNVLRAKTDGSYQVTSPDFSLAGSSLLVYSPTHPNTTRWYSNPAALFVWSSAPGDKFRYAISSSPSYDFSGKESVTSNNSVVFNLPGDGRHYFHVQRFDNGKATTEGTYPVQIDTTPPTSVLIKVSDPNPEKGEVVRFEFSAIDSVGGVQSGYYVKIDNGLFLPVGQKFLIPFIESGKHTITLRAFDRANNYSETSITITVK